LEPRFTSEEYPFSTAEQMIDLLATYFLTGNETELARNDFHDLLMGRDETFPEFKARFMIQAITGAVSESEWYYYMWNKINTSLRKATLSQKITWNGNFNDIVNHLTFADIERRRIYDLKSQQQVRAESRAKSSPKEQPSRAFPAAGTGTPCSTPSPLRGLDPKPRLTTRFDTPLPHPPRRTPGHATPVPAAPDKLRCYRCGEIGHMKSSCPKVYIATQIVDATTAENTEGSPEGAGGSWDGHDDC